jgi:hypothetical protein
LFHRHYLTNRQLIGWGRPRNNLFPSLKGKEVKWQN